MSDKLTLLKKLADQLEALRDEADEIAAQHKIVSQKIAQLEEHRLPELMEELELEEFKTASGFKLAIDTDLKAKQLNESHLAALQWLREHNEGGLIKTNVKVPFAAGSEADADALVDRLAGENIVAMKGVEVKAASLKAAVRRMLKQGKPVPLKTLGIYERTIVKVTK